MELVIRKETPADYAEVEAMNREAFYNLYVPGCDEHYLVHIMRSHPDYLPEMSFVAVHQGQIIGSIHYTRSHVIDESGNQMDTLSFGPLAVLPEFQRQGVGKALIRHTKALAVEQGVPAILIYGDPHNYVVNGFKNGKDYNVASADGRYPYGLLVLELKETVFAGHQWRLYQSKVFEFDQNDAAAFDATLPAKLKEYRPSQDLFLMAIRAFLD